MIETTSQGTNRILPASYEMADIIDTRSDIPQKPLCSSKYGDDQAQ